MSFEANPDELGGGSSEMDTEEDYEDESQGQETGYSSFVQELLKDAPQEHVKLLEPYIRKFDAGVTRRFQDLSNKYKHYDNLGWDEDTTSQMAEVYRILNEEPERMYEALREALEIEDEEQNYSSFGSQSEEEFQGLPIEVQQQLSQQQQVLEALAQYVLQDHTSKTEAMEDQEYEGYLGLLKQEYGDFDEEYVNGCIANGMDGEAAVKQWQAKEQEIIQRLSQATGNLPPALLSSAGGGAVAQQEPQNLGSIDSRDIRNLIANVLTQSNQASQ
jgi:hypothetical protein